MTASGNPLATTEASRWNERRSIGSSSVGQFGQVESREERFFLSAIDLFSKIQSEVAKYSQMKAEKLITAFEEFVLLQ